MYTEYTPCSRLSTYVDKYWEFEGTPDYGMRIHILPDGCTDFIFTLEEPAQPVDGGLVMQPYRSYFVGPMTVYSELVTYAERVHMLGVRFRPSGLLRFADLPLEECVNRRLNMEDLGIFFDLGVERLKELPDVTSRVRWVECFLLKVFGEYQGETDGAVAYAVERIDRYKGKLPVGVVAGEVCLCQRHFERKFKRFTGYTPKEYSRMSRFRYAVELLRKTVSGDLLTVALKAGYYDVAHMSHEIRQISGNTPTAFSSLAVPEEVTLTYVEV